MASHHVGKDASKKGRGHSSQQGDLDVILYTSKVGDHAMKVHVEKMKDGEAKDRPVAFKVIPMSGTIPNGNSYSGVPVVVPMTAVEQAIEQARERESLVKKHNAEKIRNLLIDCGCRSEARGMTRESLINSLTGGSLCTSSANASWYLSCWTATIKKRHREKTLAKHANQHDHTFATGRRFKI